MKLLLVTASILSLVLMLNTVDAFVLSEHQIRVKEIKVITAHPIPDYSTPNQVSIVAPKKSGSGDCITHWVKVGGVWKLEDYIPPALKLNPKAKGYRVIEAKYCIPVDAKGRYAPTSPLN